MESFQNPLIQISVDICQHLLDYRSRDGKTISPKQGD
jgi:hypothetical protein